MTLDQFMRTYTENTRDVFVLMYSNWNEIARFSMMEYFINFDGSFGDCRIDNFTVAPIDDGNVQINIWLDEADPNEEDDGIPA